MTSQVPIVENTAIPLDVPGGAKGGIRVATFTVEDDKLGTETVDVAGADKGSFAVRHAEGAPPNAYELWFVGTTPNFEDHKTGYHVDIVVDDSTIGAAGSNEVVQSFTLAVTDVNEAPAVTLTGVIAPAEYALAGTAVGTLTASDPDGTTPTLSLVDDAGGRFEIKDGKLVVKDGLRLDFEQAASHQVKVRVADGANVVDTTFTVAVVDVNPEGTAGSAANDVFVGGALADGLHGAGGNDRLIGGGGIDSLFGDAGNDEVRGGLGKDKLFGGDGNDSLFGEADIDTLKGEKGNDKLFGGLGKDLLYGGLGKDAFVFDTKLSKANLDTIKDFYAKDDAVWLDNAVFTKLGAGTPTKPKALSKNAFFVGSKAHDKDDRVIATKTKKGYDLFYDADGLGGKVQTKIGSIEFDKLDKKKFMLTAADFFVI